MMDGEDEILDLTEDQIADDDTLELEAGQEIANDDDQAEEEIIVTIGDDDPEEDEEAKAPQWVRDLRKSKREADRRIKELEAQISGPAAKVELGPKPTLADCDYDADEFEVRLATWHDAKREADAEAEAAANAVKEAEDRWNARLTNVEKQAAELGVKDYDATEENAREVLGRPLPGLPIEDMRINMIKQGAKNAALVLYALGKNRKRAEELAAIDDPVEFAFAVGRMEAELKVNRKPAVQPERTGVGSGVTTGGAADNQLDKLRAEASRTGDYSKVVAYKRRKKAA